MSPQPMSDAEIDAIIYASRQADEGPSALARRFVAARDAQWAAMIGEPVAWIAMGGKAFVDRPMLNRATAEAAVAHRNDGSTVSPLYAIKEPK